MHSHKHTPAPRWLNCALMHLQSQIQPLMAPTCINAPLHTQNALNQLKWSALLTHSKCTQPTQIKCSPYTLRMHSTNSNQVLSLHTQNALNQLKSSALWIKCAQVHLNDSNQDLQCWNVHTCTSNASKYLQRAPIQHLYTSKLEMASKTSKLLQSSSKLLQGSKSASKNPPELKLAPPTNTKPQDLS